MKGELNLQKLLEEASGKEVVRPNEIKEEIGIHPVTANDIPFRKLLFFLKKKAKKEGNERKLEKYKTLALFDELDAFDKIGRKLSNEHLIELLSEKKEVSDTDAEKHFKQMMGVEEDESS